MVAASCRDAVPLAIVVGSRPRWRGQRGGRGTPTVRRGLSGNVRHDHGLGDVNDGSSCRGAARPSAANSVPGSSTTDFRPGAGCVEAATTTSRAPAARVTRGGHDDRRRRTTTSGRRRASAPRLNAALGSGRGRPALPTDNVSRASSRSAAPATTSSSPAPARDQLEGGAGADGFNAGSGSDDLLGGAGIEHVALLPTATAQPASSTSMVTATTATAAGSRPDRWRSSRCAAASGDDIIIGDDGLNELRGSGGADRIDGARRLRPDPRRRRATTRCSPATGWPSASTAPTASTRRSRTTIDIAVRVRDAPSRSRTCSPTATATASTSRSTATTSTARPARRVRPARRRRRPGLRRRRRRRHATATATASAAGFDCDDGNRAIHPGAEEKLGNRVDEDCDKVRRPVRARSRPSRCCPRGSRADHGVVGLVLVDLDGGERVRITLPGQGLHVQDPPRTGRAEGRVAHPRQARARPEAAPRRAAERADHAPRRRAQDRDVHRARGPVAEAANPLHGARRRQGGAMLRRGALLRAVATLRALAGAAPAVRAIA